jgi:hypothetical protein
MLELGKGKGGTAVSAVQDRRDPGPHLGMPNPLFFFAFLL